MENKKAVNFFLIVTALVLVSLSITYYKYVVLKDFDILTDEELFQESLLEE